MPSFSPGPALGPLNDTLLFRMLAQKDQQQRDLMLAQQAANQQLTQTIQQGGQQYQQAKLFEAQQSQHRMDQAQQEQEFQQQQGTQQQHIAQQEAQAKAQLERQAANDAATQQYHNQSLGLQGDQLKATIEQRDAQNKIAWYNAQTNRQALDVQREKIAAQGKKMNDRLDARMKADNSNDETMLMMLKEIKQGYTAEQRADLSSVFSNTKSTANEFLNTLDPSGITSSTITQVSPEDQQVRANLKQMVNDFTGFMSHRDYGSAQSAQELKKAANRFIMEQGDPFKREAALNNLMDKLQTSIYVRGQTLSGADLSTMTPEDYDRRNDDIYQKTYGRKNAPAQNIAGQPTAQTNTSPQIDPQAAAKVGAYYQKMFNIVKDDAKARQLTDQWAAEQGL